jgi:nucleoside-diphosphate-sugar epimerase
VLGSAIVALLGAAAVPFDRRDGQDLLDAIALRAALEGCDRVIHLAALHPLIAPLDADARTYHDANVEPFVALLDAARAAGVRRVVLASSTSVWRDAPAGQPARFLDETSEADATDGYTRSKLACEALLADSGIGGVHLRLARFARAGDAEDEVRKLYRAIDPRDAATAAVAALDRAADGARYAISAPTPFRPADALLLGRDARAAIRERTGHDPVWAPARIGSVIVAARAARELGWRCAYPSTLLRVN